MCNRAKKLLLVGCMAWIIYFAVPGPRQVYGWLFGSVIRNPQYLFADSRRKACRRMRRVIENGKANIYIENLSTHKVHIFLTQRQLRTLVIACNNAL